MDVADTAPPGPVIVTSSTVKLAVEIASLNVTSTWSTPEDCQPVGW